MQWSNKIHHLFLSFLLLNLISCSWLNSYIKKIHHEPDLKVIERKEEKILCEANINKVSIYAEEIEEDMGELLNICQFNETKNTREKVRKCFLTLALYKMLQRPDRINPTSKFSFIEFNSKDASIYSDENKISGESGYWRFLISLSESWSLRNWFLKTVEIWRMKPPITIKVTRGFASVIVKKAPDKNILLVPDKDDKYSIVQNIRTKLYTRGDEFISEGEAQNYSNALKALPNQYRNFVSFTRYKNPEIEFKKFGKFDLACNFDFQSLEQGKLSPLKTPILSNVIAVNYKDYAVSMSILEENITEDLHSEIMAYFFLNPPKKETDYKKESNLAQPEIPEENKNKNAELKPLESRYPKYCLLKKNESVSLENVFLISFQGRDPAQHIVHMVQYLQEMPFAKVSFEKVMNSPRHMILDYPLRLGIEADRASESQLDKILKLDIPIFNERNLGLVLASGFIDNEMFFIPDTRGKQSYCSDLKGFKK